MLAIIMDTTSKSKLLPILALMNQAHNTTCDAKPAPSTDRFIMKYKLKRAQLRDKCQDVHHNQLGNILYQTLS